MKEQIKKHPNMKKDIEKKFSYQLSFLRKIQEECSDYINNLLDNSVNESDFSEYYTDESLSESDNEENSPLILYIEDLFGQQYEDCNLEDTFFINLPI